MPVRHEGSPTQRGRRGSIEVGGAGVKKRNASGADRAVEAVAAAEAAPPSGGFVDPLSKPTAETELAVVEMLILWAVEAVAREIPGVRAVEVAELPAMPSALPLL